MYENVKKKNIIFLELCEDVISELQVSIKSCLSIYKAVAITHCYEHHHKLQI